MKKLLFLFIAIIGIFIFSTKVLAEGQPLQKSALNRKGFSVFTNSEAKKIAFHIEGNRSAKTIYLFLSGIDKNMSEWDRLVPLMLKNDPTAAYVRIDLFGQGQTAEMNPSKQTLISYEKQVSLLKEFLATPKFRGKNINFISHSYGGAIATKFVQENPNVITKNILVAPFVDNLEVHQPGVGPFLAWSKFVSEFTGLQSFYELNVGTGTALTTILTWPAYQAVRQSETRLTNVLALTEGVRDIGMTNAISKAGQTQTSIIYSGLDELIPTSGHMHLWDNIPETSRGFLFRIPATHESVILNADQVFEAISQILQN